MPSPPLPPIIAASVEAVESYGWQDWGMGIAWNCNVDPHTFAAISAQGGAAQVISWFVKTHQLVSIEIPTLDPTVSCKVVLEQLNKDYHLVI